eukprot:904612_1
MQGMNEQEPWIVVENPTSTPDSTRLIITPPDSPTRPQIHVESPPRPRITQSPPTRPRVTIGDGLRSVHRRKETSAAPPKRDNFFLVSIGLLAILLITFASIMHSHYRLIPMSYLAHMIFSSVPSVFLVRQLHEMS